MFLLFADYSSLKVKLRFSSSSLMIVLEESLTFRLNILHEVEDEEELLEDMVSSF